MEATDLEARLHLTSCSCHHLVTLRDERTIVINPEHHQEKARGMMLWEKLIIYNQPTFIIYNGKTNLVEYVS